MVYRYNCNKEECQHFISGISRLHSNNAWRAIISRDASGIIIQTHITIEYAYRQCHALHWSFILFTRKTRIYSCWSLLDQRKFITDKQLIRRRNKSSSDLLILYLFHSTHSPFSLRPASVLYFVNIRNGSKKAILFRMSQM